MNELANNESWQRVAQQSNMKLSLNVKNADSDGVYIQNRLVNQYINYYLYFQVC